MLRLGPNESVALLIIALSTFFMYARRLPHYRWAVALLVCAAVAAVVGPSDIFSMLLGTSTLFGFYYAGSKHKSDVSE